MDDTEAFDFGLVMPFVTVMSVGGPHEDTAYAAGWAMGALDTNLEKWAQAAEFSGLVETRAEMVLREDSVAQIDLIAMKRGYTCSIEETGIQGWIRAILVWQSPPDWQESSG